MAFPRVIPHSDGAGEIDRVGRGVPGDRISQRVWCHGAQSHRPFGTAAELVVLPADRAVPLPDRTFLEQGACLGIPGLTAHRAVFADGPVRGRTVLVHGAAGAVGSLAVGLARVGGAAVIGTVRSRGDEARARAAGAHHVVVMGEGTDPASAVIAHAPQGVDRIIEVALGANAALDAAVLAPAGAIAAYSSPDPEARLPFWHLAFKNVLVRFLGSDDFPDGSHRGAAADIVKALQNDALHVTVGARFSLADIAKAHRAVEQGDAKGRVVVMV